MKKIDVGRAISILANVGVIAGIFFLAFEIRQNNALLQQQSRAIGTQQYFDTLERLIDDPSLIRLSMADSESLTPVDLERLRLMAFRTFAAWEYEWGEWQRGRFDDNDMADNERIWSNALNEIQNLRRNWDSYRRTRAAPEFGSWVEENVVNSR